MKDLSVIVVVILVIIGLIILGPLCFIWALNTLFTTLDIQYTVSTWFASLILLSILNTEVKVKK